MDRTMRGRVIAYFLFSKRWSSSAILDFHIFAIFVRKKIKLIRAYIFIVRQNLVKIGLSAAELLRIFDFQNGGRLRFGMTS